MRKFTITFTMKNGDKWVTNKDTKKQIIGRPGAATIGKSAT